MNLPNCSVQSPSSSAPSILFPPSLRSFKMQLSVSASLRPSRTACCLISMRSRSAKFAQSFQSHGRFFEADVDFKHEMSPSLVADEDAGIGGVDFMVALA